MHLHVPFYADTTDQCGPAALAELLSFWNKPIEPAALKQDLYVAKLHGTLPMDLVYAAKTHGLQIEVVRGDMSWLHSELTAGRPVLAMLNLGYAIMPVDHYVVVTGFDDDRKGLWINSAGHADQWISIKKFQRAWDKTDAWAMRASLP